MNKSTMIRPFFIGLIILGLLNSLAWAEPLINEFVFNHIGTDTYEYVEIYGEPNTDYSSYSVIEIEGDSTVAGAIDAVYTVGSTDADGFWTTGFLYNELENGTVTLLLVRNFTGAIGEIIDQDKDGIIDYAPWESVVDGLAVSDGGTLDIPYSETILSPGFDGIFSTPGGASRWPDGIDTNALTDWIRNDFDGAGLPGYIGTIDADEALNTPGSPNQLALAASPAINEFVFNHTGIDTNEYIEIFGEPDVDYSDYTILEIEGDTTLAGTIDGVYTVGSTDADGFWTTGFLYNELENGTVTLLLVRNFTGNQGEDIDADDNGVIDYAPWGTIVDSVAVMDGGIDDKVYAEIALTADYDGLGIVPGGASRIPDGLDTGSPMDWVRNDFDGYGLSGFDGTPEAGEAMNTPGTQNLLARITGVVINELDADTLSTDTMEFIELYDGGKGNTSLDGLVIVFYNGSIDTSYQAFDLDGYSTNPDGFLVIGNSAIPGASIVFPDNTLQNGADAVALYYGNADDFPTGTAVTTANIIDAIVYDTNDFDDPELLVLLNSGQPQVDEGGAGDQVGHSNQRCPNGSGGERNTANYIQATPTPGSPNNCEPNQVRIREIQGEGHRSPFEGQAVGGVSGIVTGLKPNGFYMQDPEPDENPASSEGIFVYTVSTPSVNIGDSVLVGGNIQEYYPGGFSAGNLSVTEMIGPSITVVSSGNTLPLPIIMGSGGRVPPSTIIEDDATGDVETTGVFDPGTDGIDYYESLEGMLVKVNEAITVGPTNSFGEIPVIGDLGANAGLLNARGGLVIRSDDFNPERIILDDAFLPLPEVIVGKQFNGDIVGVIDYSFGNFKLLVTQLPELLGDSLPQETTIPRNNEEISVAAFNLENLYPTADPSKFQMLGLQIANNLLAPDIIGVQEIQDNSGPIDDGVVDASLTYIELIDAIQAAGGPEYEFRDIPPVDGADGGEPGGNIRVGFLYRPDRVSFVDRPGGDALSATNVITGPIDVELTFSPGRIDPNNPAFASSRKPLAGEFIFNGNKIFVIVNHFISKARDDFLFGRVQPPVLHSETQRSQQAQVVHDFVQAILNLDSNAKIIVLGDLNDFQFSTIMSTLKGTILDNLIDSLSAEDRYTYIHDGNSEALDHILVSERLSLTGPKIDVVHVNSEYLPVDRPTDHDPVLASFFLPPPCHYDLDPDPDGDVDGFDLFIYSAGGFYDDLDKFAEEFGRPKCP